MTTRCPWRTQFLLQLLVFLKRHSWQILIKIQQSEAIIHPGCQPPQTFPGTITAAAPGKLKPQLQPQQVLRLVPGLFSRRLIESRFDQRCAAFGLHHTQQFSRETQTTCRNDPCRPPGKQGDHSLIGLPGGNLRFGQKIKS